MFINFEIFKIHARRVFKDIDTERTVARELINLEQKERCYNCNIKEHYASECRKSKKLQQVAKTEKKSKQQK